MSFRWIQIITWIGLCCFAFDLEASAPKYQNSFQITASPQFFFKKSLDSSTQFTQPSFPEISLKTGFLKTNFLLEPMIGFSYLKSKSRSAISDTNLSLKSEFKLYQFELGVRQFLSSIDKFPIAPFVDLFAIYSIMDYKLRSESRENEVSTEKYRGGEFGLQFNAGFQISITSLSDGTRADMESTWNLKDFGLEFLASYYPASLLRAGKIKELSDFTSWSLGGGLFVGW